jgi:hypothetical protein
MRNIRDYKGKIREERETLGSASPFNIVTEALTLINFTEQEVEQLYAQHTETTGQVFPLDVIQSVYHYTQGQPWLTNAIAREIIIEILENDVTKPIQLDHVEKVVETIIYRRDTHIDSLLERLKEERVRKVIEPVITGDEKIFSPFDDNLQYVIDLGLLKKEGGSLKSSNPIYTEVIVRYLSMMTQESLEYKPEYALTVYAEKGRLDMKKLLSDFQSFWRENSAIWLERYDYKEAAPHLILMAFLQRVINKGGIITREMAAGTKRLDLCIYYQNNRYPIEIKLRYSNKTIEEGKKQITDYMETLNCTEGWLVVFDQRKNQSWKRKLFWKSFKVDAKNIYVVGC